MVYQNGMYSIFLLVKSTVEGNHHVGRTDFPAVPFGRMKDNGHHLPVAERNLRCHIGKAA